MKRKREGKMKIVREREAKKEINEIEREREREKDEGERCRKTGTRNVRDCVHDKFHFFCQFDNIYLQLRQVDK